MLRAAIFLLLTAPAIADELITLEADVREMDGAWCFVAEGKTLLANGARLEVEVAVPRVETGANGEEYKYEDTIDDARATAVDGAWTAVVARVPRKPYSTTYLARVTFDPTTQANDVLMDLEKRNITVAEPVVLEVQFTLGTPDDLARERLEADQAVVSDFTATRALFQELETRFKVPYAADAAPDLAAWDEWRKEWDARRKEVEERNNERIDQDIYWRESFGKKYLEAMVEGLGELADFYREVLAAPKAERPPEEQVARAGKIFEGKYWERLDFLQISLIARPETVLAILDEVEARVKRLTELRALATKKDPSFSKEAWEKEAGDARLAFVQLPARLSSELPETYFGPITKLCRDLLALLAPAETEVDAKPIADALALLRRDAQSQRK